MPLLKKGGFNQSYGELPLTTTLHNLFGHIPLDFGLYIASSESAVNHYTMP